VGFGGLHVDPLPNQTNAVVWEFKEGALEEYNAWKAMIEA
jgi:hypothetical protein